MELAKQRRGVIPRRVVAWRGSAVSEHLMPVRVREQVRS
jgi:hypothetical protein